MFQMKDEDSMTFLVCKCAYTTYLKENIWKFDIYVLVYLKNIEIIFKTIFKILLYR